MCRTIKRLCGGLEAVWRTGGYVEDNQVKIVDGVDWRMRGGPKANGTK